MNLVLFVLVVATELSELLMEFLGFLGEREMLLRETELFLFLLVIFVFHGRFDLLQLLDDDAIY